MVFEKNLKIWKKNTKILLSISSRIVKIRVGGWYCSIQHWMYFLGGKAPPCWVFSRLFLTVFEKNLKFWKKYKKCFVVFSTCSKDTSRGLVPFDSALNVLPRGYSPPRCVFFPTCFDGFWEKSKVLKKYKNCFVDFSTYGKDTSEGLEPFDSALNVIPRGYSSPRWVFYFPDFFDGFWKKSKNLKKIQKLFCR